MLDVLAGRVDRTRKGRSVTGNITISKGTSMRYVTQESSLVGVLTVKETLVRKLGKDDHNVIACSRMDFLNNQTSECIEVCFTFSKTHV